MEAQQKGSVLKEGMQWKHSRKARLKRRNAVEAQQKGSARSYPSAPGSTDGCAVAARPPSSQLLSLEVVALPALAAIATASSTNERQRSHAARTVETQRKAGKGKLLHTDPRTPQALPARPRSRR